MELLNFPHPLDTLSNVSSYGNDGRAPALPHPFKPLIMVLSITAEEIHC